MLPLTEMCMSAFRLRRVRGASFIALRANVGDVSVATSQNGTVRRSSVVVVVTFGLMVNDTSGRSGRDGAQKIKIMLGRFGLNEYRDYAMRNENRGDYPPRWYRISQRVKRLNGYRCERCRHPDPPDCSPRGYACDHLCRHAKDGKKRILTTHHLDGDKANVRLWNLASLCQVCHLVIQGRVAFYQGYALPHTPWMQRHVDRYERERARRMAA